MSMLIAISDDLTWDAVLADGQIQQDPGLFSAVGVSLLTDGYASPDDLTEAGLPTDTPTGWWADAYPEFEGDRIGSKLWLLKRYSWAGDKITSRGAQWAEEALEWMVEDGIALTVEATALRLSSDHLYLRVEITRPDGTRWASRWAYALGDAASAGSEE